MTFGTKNVEDIRIHATCSKYILCLWHSCCNADAFSNEIIIFYVIFFLIAVFLVLFFSIRIHLKVHIGEKRNFHNYFILFKNLAISIFTVTLIMVKIFETSWFNNILIIGNADPETTFNLSSMITEHE